MTPRIKCIEFSNTQRLMILKYIYNKNNVGSNFGNLLYYTKFYDDIYEGKCILNKDRY